MNELQRVAREKLGSFGAWLAFTRENLDLFRDLLRRSSCARMRVSTEFQPFPFWDDVQVPVAAIPEFLRDAQSLLQKGRLVYSVGGHVGAGQLSIQPILPYSVDEERCALALSDNFENLVLKYGGEIGSARGNGRVRTAALTKRFPKLSRAFVAIKDVLDPENMFNPDCVVSPEMRRYAAQDRDAARGADALSALDEDALLAPEADAALRESSLHSRAIRRRTSFVSDEFPSSPSSSRSRRQLEYQLAWDPRVIIEPLRQCNGCGHCRLRTSETRLCPAFRNTPEEESSCRAKANLLRGAADGSLPLETLTRDGAVEFGLRCLRCHNCATECPAQVDAARLAFRLRSAAVAAKGLGFPELCASRLENTLRVASAFAPLSNQMLKTWLAALAPTHPWRRGTATRPQAPRRANAARSPESFVNTTRNSPPSRVPSTRARPPLKIKPKVSLVVDAFERFFDTKLAEAAIEVLERNGIAVRVLERPRNVGIPSYALGDLDRARELANRNVATLREAMRNGSTIVALEPATAACVVKDYPYFCNDADAKKVYENTTDLCGYLASLDARGEFNRDDLKRFPACGASDTMPRAQASLFKGRVTLSDLRAEPPRDDSGARSSANQTRMLRFRVLLWVHETPIL